MSVALVQTGDALYEALESDRDRLLGRLRVQRAQAAPLWAWYAGKQPLPAVSARYRPAYRLLLELSRTPWARLVVDAISERLHVQGFETRDRADEAEAWALFLASSLDADEWLVYTEALITGSGYVSVSASDVEGGPAVIAPESAFEVTHEPAPGNRRRVAQAVKVYPLDWSGLGFACELYRPEATYRWLTEVTGQPLDAEKFPIDDVARAESIRWEPDDPFETPNPLGVVPVIPFENRATILGGGFSELEDCVPILRRIDKLTLDKLMTSEFASFRQRWATGLEVPRDPETGNPVEPYTAAVTKLWVSDNPDTRFGTFEASDLDPYLQAIDADIAALAAISRVPAHYLIQTSLANPPSAESLIAGESGLVAKVRERQRRFGEAWERALALALAIERGSADVPALAVIWADAEMRNPAQVADAAVKLQTIGVPQEALWRYIGATPTEVAEWSLEATAATLVEAA